MAAEINYALRESAFKNIWFESYKIRINGSESVIIKLPGHIRAEEFNELKGRFSDQLFFYVGIDMGTDAVSFHLGIKTEGIKITFFRADFSEHFMDVFE